MVTSELAYTAIRIGFLALLWILVFASLAILRRDIFGTVIKSRGHGRRPLSAKTHEHKNSSDSKDTSRSPRYLVVTAGPLTGTTMPLGSAPIIIGRSPSCTLVLDDTYASSRHARLYLHDGSWYIEDMNSTNGTFIDGERMVAPQKLAIGLQVRIGQTIMELSR